MFCSISAVACSFEFLWWWLGAGGIGGGCSQRLLCLNSTTVMVVLLLRLWLLLGCDKKLNQMIRDGWMGAPMGWDGGMD